MVRTNINWKKFACVCLVVSGSSLLGSNALARPIYSGNDSYFENALVHDRAGNKHFVNVYIGKSSCTFRDSFQPLEVSGEWAVPPDSDNLVCVSDEGDALFELYDFRFFPEFTSVVARGRMLDSRYSNRDFEWHLSDARHRDD